MSVSDWDVDDRTGHECAANVNTRRAGDPGWGDNVGEGVRSPLVRRRRGEWAAAVQVDDAEALRRDGDDMYRSGDGVAHLDRKGGCGSLPEVPRSCLDVLSGEHAGEGDGDGVPHGDGIAFEDGDRHLRRTWRGRESGTPCGDGDAKLDHDGGRARSHSATVRWGCLRDRRRI